MKKDYTHFKSNGFTLIELLVSVAIIAVLTVVVMWAISSAKTKNADAAVKQALSSIPNQSGIYHLDNETFDDFCTEDIPGSAYPIVLNAAQNIGLTGVTVNNTGTLSTATCNTDGIHWAVEVPLLNKNVGGEGASAMFCVDSRGFVGTRNSSFGLSITCLPS